MSASAKWADLKVRLLSGLALAVVGLGAVELGGWWFRALIIAAAGLMWWELSVMLGAAGRRALLLGVLGAVGALVGQGLGGQPGLTAELLATLMLTMAVARDRAIGLVYGLAILVGAAGLMGFRAGFGARWMLWLVLVVIVTDVFGYFAGRLIGGPKFWPRVSPKKTWSGTVAGWIGAAITGAVFVGFTGHGGALIWISVLVSFASQLGDIAESAIKRRTGVKDSSRLIPGHGGVLDRFDGLLGAALMLVLLTLVLGGPAIRI